MKNFIRTRRSLKRNYCNQGPWKFGIYKSDFDLSDQTPPRYSAGNVLLEQIAVEKKLNSNDIKKILSEQNAQTYIFDAVLKIVTLPSFMLEVALEVLQDKEQKSFLDYLNQSTEKLLITMLQLSAFRQYIIKDKDKHNQKLIREFTLDHIKNHRYFRHLSNEEFQSSAENEINSKLQTIFDLASEIERLSNQDIKTQLSELDPKSLNSVNHYKTAFIISRAIEEPQGIDTEHLSHLIVALPRTILSSIIFDIESLLETLKRMSLPFRRDLIEILAKSDGNHLLSFASQPGDILEIATLCNNPPADIMPLSIAGILIKTMFLLPCNNRYEKGLNLKKLYDCLPYTPDELKNNAINTLEQNDYSQPYLCAHDLTIDMIKLEKKPIDSCVDSLILQFINFTSTNVDPALSAFIITRALENPPYRNLGSQAITSTPLPNDQLIFLIYDYQSLFEILNKIDPCFQNQLIIKISNNIKLTFKIPENRTQRFKHLLKIADLCLKDNDDSRHTAQILINTVINLFSPSKCDITVHLNKLYQHFPEKFRCHIKNLFHYGEDFQKHIDYFITLAAEYVDALEQTKPVNWPLLFIHPDELINVSRSILELLNFSSSEYRKVLSLKNYINDQAIQTQFIKKFSDFCYNPDRLHFQPQKKIR